MNERRSDNQMQHDDMAAVHDRLTSLETKVNILIQHMERATGAWLFMKIMGSFAIGLTILWNFGADIFNKWPKK